MPARPKPAAPARPKPADETTPQGEEAVSFDPLALLTPQMVEGIRPALRCLKDGAPKLAHLSVNDVKKIRCLATWLEMIEAHISGRTTVETEAPGESELELEVLRPQDEE